MSINQARVAFNLAIVLVLTSTATAQYPQASLDWVYPMGGQKGTEFAVQVKGEDLDAAERLDFSHPGITSKPQMEESMLSGGERAKENAFVVSVGKDVPVGTYEARVVGQYGVSNPRPFVVVDEKVVEATQSNDPEKAPELAVGSTVFSRASGNDFNYYRIPLEQGQRVRIACRAESLDSKMDATLVLCDPTGNQIKANRDYNGRDPMLDFEAPTAGEYLLKVYDFVYGGGDDHFYQLAVSTGPFVDFVFPPVVAPGSKTKLTIFGRNLPSGSETDDVVLGGTKLEQQQIDFQADGQPETAELADAHRAEVAGFPLRVEAGGATSNARHIGVANADVIVEAEPNNRPEEAQSLNVPCEFVGQFNPRGDLDWVTFEANVGDVYWIEVFSERLGLPTDPHLIIQRLDDQNGEVVAKEVKQADDGGVDNGVDPGSSLPTADPLVRFEADRDATYRILVRDLFGSARGGPQLVYRLAIRKPQPDFRLVAVQKSPGTTKSNPKPKPAAPALRQGGITAIDVLAFRRDGFEGEITLSVEGLPKGVTAFETVLGPKQQAGTIVLAAEENAPAGMGKIRVVGKSEVDGKEVARTALPSTMVWPLDNNQSAYTPRLTSELPLAVIGEVAPFTVRVTEGKTIETVRGAKFDVSLKVDAHGEINGDVQTDRTDINGVFRINNTKMKAGSEGKVSVQIDNDAPPGTYVLPVTCRAKVKYERNPEAAKQAEADKEEITKIAKELEEATKKAQEELKKAEEELKNAEDDKKDEKKKKVEELKKAAEEAERKSKAAQDERKRLESRAKQLVDSAKKKDRNVLAYSEPIALVIYSSPIKPTIDDSPQKVKQGQKTELPIRFERRLDFKDEVEVQASVENGKKGLKLKNFKIEGGKDEGKLEIEAAEDAQLGEHEVEIRLRTKYENQTLDEEIKLVVQVEEK